MYFLRQKYELGCVNNISHAHEIMNMYKNTNKKNSIFLKQHDVQEA